MADCTSVHVGFGGVGMKKAGDCAIVGRWRGVTEGAAWERGGGDASEKSAYLVVFDDRKQAGVAQL